MKLPLIHGTIDRRILANYRIVPDVIARLLPAPFRPRIIQGYAIAGICLIRLRHIRPRGLPGFLGLSSENAAHRIAVEWDDANGQTLQGVYIARRDTSSRINALAGGRIFTGVHQHARFQVIESHDHFHVALESDDSQTRVRIDGHLTDKWFGGSLFSDLNSASSFFEEGSLGYSPSSSPQVLDALELRCHRWSAEPLAIERIESSFFDDRHKFPGGSLTFDCALLMRHIPHEWHERQSMLIAN